MSNLISVIIPTFNRAHLIKETIESLRNQTYTNWECIIIDGGSTDHSELKIPSYFESDNRFQFYSLTKNQNKGPNPSRNYGYLKAKGDFIYFFDSDDLLLPSAFETYISNFSDEYDTVIARLEKIDFYSKKVISTNKIYSDNLIEDYFTGVVSFYVCGPMWRKSFFEGLDELFDEEISNLDDWDFNLRMLYKRPKIKFLNEVLVQYFQHNDSLKTELNKLNLKEIDSAFRARFKHVELISTHKFGNENLFLEHISNFYRHYLRLTLRNKSEDYFYFFKEIIKLDCKLFHFHKVIKVIAGTYLHKFFNKGERFLR